MTESNASDLGNTKEAKLPRRDWIVLPMLSLVTIFVMVGSAELFARRMFTYSSTGIKDCTAFNNPSTGPHGIPNCVSWEKAYENQPVEYRMNSGHRAGMEFGPKPPGTYRIVISGSSIAMGYGVESEKTFGALLPGEISRRTGRRVELLNEAFVGSGGVALRLDEALAAKPDLILWILAPWDIGQGSATVNHVQETESSIEKTFDLSRTALLLRHFLFESQSQFVKSYLMGDDEETGFLKVTPSAEWSKRLRQFCGAAAEDEARAKVVGLPLVAVLVPNRAQAAMISMGEWPAGYDPYKLDDEVRSIISRHGGTYIDILSEFSNIPNAEQYYFLVDGQPNARGQAILSPLVARG